MYVTIIEVGRVEFYMQSDIIDRNESGDLFGGSEYIFIVQ